MTRFTTLGSKLTPGTLNKVNKDVLQSFPVIFDVKILLKNWPARHQTNSDFR